MINEIRNAAIPVTWQQFLSYVNIKYLNITKIS